VGGELSPDPLYGHVTHQSAGQMLREGFGSSVAVNHKALLGLNLSAASTLPPAISQMTG